MKVLWISNAPWAPSGYGSQTRQVGTRIAGSGHDIEFVANDGTRGDQMWNGLLVRGSGYDRYSRDSLRDDLDRSGADWTIALYDAWVFTDKVEDPFKGMPHVAGWVPVDHYPCPPTLIPWLREHTAIAMSRYGYDRLVEASGQLDADTTGKGFPVRYAPHAVDAVFVPTAVAPGFGKPFRQVIGVPDDAYLVGIVAANTGTGIYDRKGFGDMVAALSVFMAEHPDAYVYLHTLQQGHEGIVLPILMAVKGLPAERIRWADQYLLKKQSIRDEDMAAIYSSFDVLLGTSRGEGFGLPHIEAQACGTPVILSNWTASAELVGDVWSPDRMGMERHPSGWLVDVDPDYDPRQAADFGKPRIGSIIVALREAYDRRGDPALRDAAVAKASTYRADAVFAEHWVPILDEMAGLVDAHKAAAAGEADRLTAAATKRERRAARNLTLVT